MAAAVEHVVSHPWIINKQIRYWHLQPAIVAGYLDKLFPSVKHHGEYPFFAINEHWRREPDGAERIVDRELSAVLGFDRDKPDFTNGIWAPLLKAGTDNEAWALAIFRAWFKQAGYTATSAIQQPNGWCQKCAAAGKFIRTALVCPQCRAFLGGF